MSDFEPVLEWTGTARRSVPVRESIISGGLRGGLCGGLRGGLRHGGRSGRAACGEPRGLSDLEPMLEWAETARTSVPVGESIIRGGTCGGTCGSYCRHRSLAQAGA